jgi:hypothetical protein
MNGAAALLAAGRTDRLAAAPVLGRPFKVCEEEIALPIVLHIFNLQATCSSVKKSRPVARRYGPTLASLASIC